MVPETIPEEEEEEEDVEMSLEASQVKVIMAYKKIEDNEESEFKVLEGVSDTKEV
jgi:hypothetical protein